MLLPSKPFARASAIGPDGTAITMGIARRVLYRLGLGKLIPVNKRVAHGPSVNPIYSIRWYLAIIAIIELVKAARFDDGDGER